MKILKEADNTSVNSINFQLAQEDKLKELLIANLRDDGRGHHHNLFADRLESFDLRIVPLKHQIETAAISFDKAIIYVNEGFLRVKRPIEQLNVIMRHELAHNLMMHQIRMMHYISEKCGKEQWQHLSQSSVINTLFNIVMDAEISHNRYTNADKRIVKYMECNYTLIGGILTENMRAQ